MNESLRYLMKKSVINSFKKTLKRPVKAFGILLLVIYYLMIPFIVEPLMTDMGLKNKEGFVLIASIVTLYIVLPTTLSYFKRKGINFKNQDINFILASPTSPKQAIIYGLSKEIFINMVMQIMIFIAAVFVFNISLLTTVILIAVNMVFSNLLRNSLAMIMYASEDITLKQKQLIKKIVYSLLALFTVFSLTIVISQTIKAGFDFSYINSVITSFSYLTSVITSPVVLMFPVFGWQLGWINLMILGPTPYTLISTGLYFISSIYFTHVAYKMVCKGEYYEDALSFSKHVSHITSKKGNITIAEMFGRKNKRYDYKGKLKGLYAKVIFHKQIIELRRSKKIILSLKDFVYLVIGIGLGVASVFFDDFITSEYFFEIIVGIGMYLTVFIKTRSSWKNEFENYYIFIMPDSSINKLFRATLLENILSFIRAIFLAVPAGILMRAPLWQIVGAIIAQTLIKVMMTYVSIYIEEIIGAKIGKILASFINFTVLIVFVIIPIVAILIIMNGMLFISFSIIVLYTIGVIILFLALAAINLTNIESLEE